MLVPFLIMLREGIEAALIVCIIAGYLRQTGRTAWLPAVWAGVVAAALLCLALGIVLDALSAEFPQREQELFEGLVALVAVGMLTWMVFWMARAARSIRAQLQQRIDLALAPEPGQGGRVQGFALVGVVFLAVGREGLESVFFLLATFQQDVGWSVPAGALLGLAGAVAVGAAIFWAGARIDLRRFFRWTSVFILFVAAGLLASAVRAFHEAGLWNALQGRAWNLTETLPIDSPLGTILAALFGYHDAPSVGEVLAWLGFLLPALILLAAHQQRPAPVAAAG